VECGALPALIQALQVQKQKVRDECVKCLDIIIKSSTRFREQVIWNGGLISLLRCADEATGENSRAHALSAVSNIFSDEYRPRVELITSSIPYFVQMLRSDRDPVVIVECSKTLCHLVNFYPDLHRMILDHGAKKLLQDLLLHEDESVVVSSIRLTRHLISPRGKRERSSTGPPFCRYSYPSRDEQEGAQTCEKNIDSRSHYHNYPYWGSSRFPYKVPSSVVTPSMDPSTKLSQTHINEGPRKERLMPAHRNHWHSYDHCKKSATNSAPGSLWRSNSSPHFVFGEKNAREYSSQLPCSVDSSPLVLNKNSGQHDSAQSPNIPQVVRLSHTFHSVENSDYKLHQNVTREILGHDFKLPEVNEVEHTAHMTATESNKDNDILLEKEKYLLSDFTVLVLEQLRPCSIQNKMCLPDSRYPFPVGFPGLECKHCAGTRDARRFFWSTAVRFKNNNGEFAKHLLKCTHCPDTVKDQMNFMKTYHTKQMKSLPRGNMSLVFRRLFNRLQVKKDSA